MEMRLGEICALDVSSDYGYGEEVLFFFSLNFVFPF